MVRSCVVACTAAACVAMLAGEAAVAQGSDCDGWVALHEMMPRRNPVMLRTGPETAFLFGGSLTGSSGLIPTTATSETWRFDGTRWRFVTTSGPSTRALTAGAYDSAQGRVILFGGQAINPENGLAINVNDTWEFADGNWSLLSTPSAPSARYGHAMVYDPSRNRTFLYGGANISSGLFWMFDGANWTEIPLTSSNPGPQLNHTLTFDPRDNSVVLLSAQVAWKWNGSQWSPLTAPGVQPSSAFFDANLNTIIIASTIGFFYTYSGSAPAQQILGLPPGVGTALIPSVVPTERGWLTLVTPSSVTVPTPTHYFVSPSAGWQALAVRPEPNASQDVAFSYHTPTNECVLFGGSRTLFGAAVPETWLLRGETWRQWTGSQPGARVRAFLEFSPERDASVLLGGSVSDPALWSWTGESWTSSPAGNVVAMPGTPPAYDASRDAIVWPLWTSVVLVNEEIATIASPGRQTDQGATAFDPVRGTLFASGQVLSRLTGSAPNLRWEQVPLVPTPLPAGAARMVYDPDRGGVILFGGFNGAAGDSSNFPRRTYFLGSDADRWTTLPLAFNGPVGRKFAGMDYDPVAKRIVMYGGTNHSSTAPLRETWKLARGPAAVALEPAETFVVPGQTAEVFIIASGGGVIEYQWFKDGTPLANSSRITGADSDTLQIQGFTSDDDGEYHVTVHNLCGDDQSIAVQVRAIPACPGDFDNSGGVDASDIAAFFSAYERGLLLADVDLSGGIDATDMAVFFASFEAGGC